MKKKIEEGKRLSKTKTAERRGGCGVVMGTGDERDACLTKAAMSSGRSELCELAEKNEVASYLGRKLKAAKFCGAVAGDGGSP